MWSKAIGGACAAVLLFVQPAAAHTPTEGEQEYPVPQVTQVWHLGASAQASWFKSVVQSAATTGWAIGNDTRAPIWLEGSGGAVVEYLSNSQVPNTTECPSTFWYACTEYLLPNSTTWTKTVFNSVQNTGGTTPWYWCADPGQPDTNCIHHGRSMVHELGHAAGLARQSNGDVHPSGTATVTVMQLNPIRNNASGWNTVQLGTCDLIELQREYDISPLSGSYASCVDHIPSPGTHNIGGDVRIWTYATLSPPSSLGCIGIPLTVHGAGLIRGDASDPDLLDRISGNPLSGRTMRIERSTVGAGSWSLVTTDAVDSAGSWSATINSNVTGTWDYRSYFPGEGSTLQLDPSVVYPIQWTNSPTVCS